MASRNDVSTAILAKLTSMTLDTNFLPSSSWLLVSNRLKLWGDVSPDLKPCVYLVTHKESDPYTHLGTLRRTLNYQFWVYLRTSDDAPGQPQLDSLLQSFENTFNVPDNFSSNSNTLGGLVYWARIQGRIFKDPGDIDNDAVMIVPFDVEMP